MIEEIILNYLGDEIAPVPVLMEVPEVPSEEYQAFPDSLVVIEKVGAGREDRIDQASIAFQSYGKTLYEAAALDHEVRKAVERMNELPEIGGVYLASNYNFTDTRSKRYRYQCVYDIYYVEGE